MKHTLSQRTSLVFALFIPIFIQGCIAVNSENLKRTYTPIYSSAKVTDYPAIGEIKTIEKPWIVADDDGIQCVSLQAAPVVVSMIKQLVEIFKL